MLQQILLKLLKRKKVIGYKKYCTNPRGRALLFFKTDSFFVPSLAKKYSHINYWEALEIAKMLNEFGYIVDIFDRTLDTEKTSIEDIYDVFVGIGGGMSGKSYPDIAKKLTKAVKILFVSSQVPKVFNAALESRYAYFAQRHPEITLPPIGFKDGIDIEAVAAIADAIFCESEGYVLDQYKELGKPVYQINVPTSPYIAFSPFDIQKRDQKSFLYFGSNRNILKGLDLLIEVFAKIPDMQLYICTPAQEEVFNETYASVLKTCKNIHWEGFVRIGSKQFNDLTNQCGYVILPSCSDSIPTSVTTCMRKGMIPVVTPECGLAVGDFGYIMNSIEIPALDEQVKTIAKISQQEFINRSLKTYEASFAYTEAKFSESFRTSLMHVLLKQ